MATLEPSLALHTCESALRELMSHAYRAAYGQGWLDKISSPEQREAWAGRASDEESRRRGAVAVPRAGLAYSEFYELIDIVEKHWEPLAPALKKKADTLLLLRRVDRLRNAVAHSRPLLSHERDLLSGIAGQIRNEVTIYMSTQDRHGQYYPRIESVTDSFGNRFEVKGHGPNGGGCITRLTLHPGDVVTFTCLGTDPQDRPLRWWRSGINSVPVVSPPGQAAELQWVVANGDVAVDRNALIMMAADGTEFHRAGTFDQRVYFKYTVDPPVPDGVAH